MRDPIKQAMQDYDRFCIKLLLLSIIRPDKPSEESK